MSVKLRWFFICTSCSRWGSIGVGFVNRNCGNCDCSGWVYLAR